MKKKAENIVQFPKSAIVHPSRTALHSNTVPDGIKEIKDAVYLIKMQKIGQIMETMLPLIAQGLATYHINIMHMTTEDTVKSTALMIESVKAFLYRQFGLEHPLHQLADTLIEQDKDGLVIRKMKVTETESSNNA